MNAGTDADKCYKLADNWNNSSTAVTATVGTEAHPFTGTFDGNGKTLYVAISETTTNGTAPFRDIQGATIKNLAVEGTVTGRTHAAGLVGIVRAGGTTTISGCVVKTSVTSAGDGDKHIGGVVGHGTTATLVIENTVFSGDLNNPADYAGGFVGWSGNNTLTIDNSFFTGTHSGQGLFHPIALHNAGETTKFTNQGAYYLSTATSTVANANYIVAAGNPVYAEQPAEGTYAALTAADGNTYYAEGVAYIERSWNATTKKVVKTNRVATSYITIEGEHPDDWLQLGGAAAGNTWYVAKGASHYKVLKIVGTVHLILTDDAALDVNHIKLESGNTLHVYSNNNNTYATRGKLRASNYYKSAEKTVVYSGAASIGGGYKADMGSLYVHGGYVAAYQIEGSTGAGIGGGEDGDIDGEVVVMGGYVKVSGQQDGAAIGGGDDGNQGGPVKIYGGELELTSGKGAGIGGGNCGDGNRVEIWGGTVRAYGGGAGIGGGRKGTGGDVHIHGGNVFAKDGGNGAGIGGSDGGDGGTLEVTGGYVYASGSESSSYYSAPGIGGGINGKGGSVTITGGTVIAVADRGSNDKSYAHAIGGGYSTWRNDLYDAGTISIADGLKVWNNSKNYVIDFNGEPFREVNPGDLYTALYCYRNTVALSKSVSYVKIESCIHNDKFVYSIGDNAYHQKICHICAHSEIEEHAAENCPCGLTGYDFALFVPDTQNGGYKVLETCKVNINNDFYLPECSVVPAGYTFKGWEMNPETVGNYAAILGQDIKEPGVSVKSLTGMDNARFYARYLYDFVDTWTWTDASTVTLKLHSDAIATDAEYSTATGVTISDPQDITNESGNVYGKRYEATFTLTKDGYEYKFNSTYDIMNTLTIANSSNNATAIAGAEGKTMYSVTLDGRTLYRDGSWNTLCLPFTVSLTGYNPLFGATDVRALSSTSYDSASGTLTLNFTTSDEITAGTPFILKWENNGQGDITNPEFEDVTIPENVAAGNSTPDNSYVSFRGSFSPIGLEANDKSVLYLGAENKLYWPSASMTVGSCRAVFALNGLTAGDLPNEARAFVLNFDNGETTSLSEKGIVKSEKIAADAGWYTLDGRKLSDKPNVKGIYINNGDKIVIK